MQVCKFVIYVLGNSKYLLFGGLQVSPGSRGFGQKVESVTDCHFATFRSMYCINI